MIKNELDKILENHKLWLNDEGGACADLRGIDLRGIDLSGSDLSDSELSGANLNGINLLY